MSLEECPICGYEYLTPTAPSESEPDSGTIYVCPCGIVLPGANYHMPSKEERIGKPALEKGKTKQLMKDLLDRLTHLGNILKVVKPNS